jgi:hypothetical protein
VPSIAIARLKLIDVNEAKVPQLGVGGKFISFSQKVKGTDEEYYVESKYSQRGLRTVPENGKLIVFYGIMMNGWFKLILHYAFLLARREVLLVRDRGGGAEACAVEHRVPGAGAAGPDPVGADLHVPFIPPSSERDGN